LISKFEFSNYRAREFIFTFLVKGRAEKKLDHLHLLVFFAAAAVFETITFNIFFCVF